MSSEQSIMGLREQILANATYLIPNPTSPAEKSRRELFEIVTFSHPSDHKYQAALAVGCSRELFDEGEVPMEQVPIRGAWKKTVGAALESLLIIGSKRLLTMES